MVQPCLGVLTDRLGGRAVLPLFLLVLAAGLGLMSVLTVELLGFARFPVAISCFVCIRGIAIGGLDTATNANINQWFIKRRGRSVRMQYYAGELSACLQLTPCVHTMVSESWPSRTSA